MAVRGTKDAIVLFVGDILFWYIALFCALFLRELSTPSVEVFLVHITPFTFIFVVWMMVFFIADLYANQMLARAKLPTLLFNTHLVNSGIAVIFFYFIPYFGITPKTVLFIHLVLSFALTLLWRIFIAPYVLRGRKTKVLLIGEGEYIDELYGRLTTQYGRTFSVTNISPHENFIDEIKKGVYTTVVFNPRDAAIQDASADLYNVLFSRIRFIDLHELYEEIFWKVPLSSLDDNWFLENISNHPKRAYEFGKRFMDIVIATPLFIVTLLLYPLIYVAIKLDDGGPLFFTQERVGQNGKPITIWKFRTMSKRDATIHGSADNKVTKIGRFLRKSRIDELPQLINVIRGDVSLIGPRPEFRDGTELYAKELPYYGARYLIQPGLSGWAQIYHEQHPHHEADVVETKNKLSYDLYYVKNRGLMLDLKIALKTIKTLLSRTGA